MSELLHRLVCIISETGIPIDDEWCERVARAAVDYLARQAPVEAGPEQPRACVRRFAVAMETALRANAHKGGWDGDPAEDLADRVIEEAEELREAVRGQGAARVLAEAADVANMAMMVADVCGTLPADPDVVMRAQLCAVMADAEIARMRYDAGARDLREERDAAVAEVERLRVQLAGCGVAAHDGSIEQEAAPGSYGWSPAYADVLALRREYNAAVAEVERQRAINIDVAARYHNVFNLLDRAYRAYRAYRAQLAAAGITVEDA